MALEVGSRDQPAGLPARPGDRVGRYEILAELGRGGMGIVFRARDVGLPREVALKCPWPALAADPDCRRRFLQEAEAAASLSHPNIIQVIETLEAAGSPWIVLQYVPGRDLEVLLAERGKLPIETALRYGEDLASAVKAAHDRNVLHRDIKPRNVLITPDDRALLGDFGLARVCSEIRSDATAPTESPSLTPTGAVLGTPRYMSPEQALGRPVDKRSDIFSLGVVMYEMCTGARAFSAAQPVAVYDAIIHGEPDPISRYRHDVPQELERIIRKSMAKLPEERFQDGAELLADLRALRHQRDYQAYVEAHPSVVPPVRKRRSRLVPWIAAGVLLAAAAILVRPWVVREPPLPHAQSFPVTSGDAWECQPALSPDGGRIAYASDAGGNFDIYLIDVHGGVPLRLTDDPAMDVYPEWFPNGGELAFVSDRGGEASIWKTGQLGGGATLLVPNATHPAISPDGARIAFTRQGSDAYLRVWVAPIDDPARATVLTDSKGGVWDHQHPAWSPDGQWICYGTRHGLWLVPSAGGPSRRLTRDAELDGEPAWSPSGRRIYFASERDRNLALWRVAFRDGTAERVTMGTGRECQPSLSRDGARLAYATQSASHALVIRDIATGKESVSSTPADAEQATFSPDQRLLAFVSSRAGKKRDIWLQPLEGGAPSGPPRRLTDDPGEATHPAFSPDGRWIAYYRIAGEDRNLCVIPARGGQAIALTTGPVRDIDPAWSPDGRTLAFASEREDGSHLWAVAVDEGRPAGPPRRVADEAMQAVDPAWSPDGREIAFVGTDAGANEVWVIPLDGHAQARRITRGANATRVRWSGSRGEILVCGTWGKDRFTLRGVPPNGGETSAPDPSVDLGGETSVPRFDVSSDGRLVVFTREETKGTVWVLEAKEGAY